MSSKEIADLLYSTISVPREIVPVVDHPLVQRLRRVRQLQTVHRVYPSATHTRFEHSVGVMHLSGIFADHLSEYADDPKYLRTVSMLAGLLHDVGHGPFSHTFDEVIRNEYKPGWNHEKFGHMLIKDTDLGDVIEKYAGYPAEEVVEFLESRRPPRSYIVVNRIYPSDILDFINRDRLYTNVDVAFVKRERLIRNTIVDHDRKIFRLRSKAVDTLRTLLISRRDLFTKVYFHKTSLIFDKLIRKIMYAKYSELANALDKALENDYSLFLRLTDDNLIRDAYMDGSLRNLAMNILSRKLHLKCVYWEERPVNDRFVIKGLKTSIEEALEREGIRNYDVDVRYLKTVPDSPLDDEGRILLENGSKDFKYILPDGALNYAYIRVYVYRDEYRPGLDEVVLRALDEGSTLRKTGITM